jgi:hypothetical protein
VIAGQDLSLLSGYDIQGPVFKHLGHLGVRWIYFADNRHWGLHATGLTKLAALDRLFEVMQEHQQMLLRLQAEEAALKASSLLPAVKGLE